MDHGNRTPRHPWFHRREMMIFGFQQGVNLSESSWTINVFSSWPASSSNISWLHLLSYIYTYPFMRHMHTESHSQTLNLHVLLLHIDLGIHPHIDIYTYIHQFIASIVYSYLLHLYIYIYIHVFCLIAYYYRV